jgi:hypothetical protein
MSSLAFQTKCPCGVTLSAGLKKPTQMEAVVQRLSCPACKSRFLISCEVVRDKIPREYKTDFEIIDLSDKATAAMQALIDQTTDKTMEESNGETKTEPS